MPCSAAIAGGEYPYPKSQTGELEQFVRGEEIRDFERGGVRRVGAVSAIILNAGAEVAADRAGNGFCRIGGTHGFAPASYGAACFEDHNDDFAGAHELGEFGEKSLAAMDGIETFGLGLREA